MKFVMYSAIVALIVVNNYSYAATNKCEDLFNSTVLNKSRPTLSLKKKQTSVESVDQKFLKKYSKSDVDFLIENISIIQKHESSSDGRSPHMIMIRALEKYANGEASEMIQRSFIVIEYMVENGFLRDVEQIRSNHRDALFSSYVKALFFNALNAMEARSIGKTDAINSRMEKSFIKHKFLI